MQASGNTNSNPTLEVLRELIAEIRQTPPQPMSVGSSQSDKTITLQMPPPLEDKLPEEDVKRWFGRVRLHLQYNYIKKEAVLQVLFVAQHFASSLATYWQAIEYDRVIGPNADILDLESLEQWALGYSLPGLTAQDYVEQLKNIRQTRDVRDYITRFRYIMVKLPTFAEEFKVFFFFYGLRPQIKAKLSKKLSISLSEIEVLALNIEKDKLSSPQSLPSLRTPSVGKNEFKPNVATCPNNMHHYSALICQLCKKEGHSAKQCFWRLKGNQPPHQEKRPLNFRGYIVRSPSLAPIPLGGLHHGFLHKSPG